MKMAVAYRAGAAALAVCLAFAAGCQEREGTGGMAGQRGDVTVYRNIQFEDIPVPAGYRLLYPASHSFQGAMSRSGVFHYEGMVEWTAAIDFFRTELTRAGWELGKTERGFAFRILHFRKGQEVLIVTVRQIRNGSRAELQLDNIERNDLLLRGKLETPQR